MSADMERYVKALGRMQSGVASDMALNNPRDAGTSPKQLRVGVNSALVDQAGLANLLVEKGIITDEEYQRAIADAMEQEAERYTARLRRITGIAGLHLGEAGLGERPNDAPGRTPGGEG